MGSPQATTRSLAGAIANELLWNRPPPSYFYNVLWIEWVFQVGQWIISAGIRFLLVFHYNLAVPFFDICVQYPVGNDGVPAQVFLITLVIAPIGSGNLTELC